MESPRPRSAIGGGVYLTLVYKSNQGSRIIPGYFLKLHHQPMPLIVCAGPGGLNSPDHAIDYNGPVSGK